MSRFRDCRYEATCRDYALNHCDGCNEWEWVFNKPTQPTVDAVVVVRCKDCKYYLNSNEKCGLVDTRLRFYETDKVWTEDSFCSWGERREDGKID